MRIPCNLEMEPPSFTTSTAKNLLIGMVVCGWTALLIICCLSPAFRVYDEQMHLSLSELLLKEKDLLSILDADSPSSIGPTHIILHALLSPLTQLEPVKVRLCNLLMSFLAVLAAGQLAKLWLKPYSGSSISIHLAVHGFCLCTPAFWVTSGIGLTESHTFLFVTLGLLLNPLWQSPTVDNPHKAILFSILSGLLISLAICSRQQLLPIVPFIALAMFLEKRYAASAIFTITSGILPLALFTYWGGISRPSTQSFTQGAIHWEFGAYSFAYLLFIGFLVNPRKALPFKASWLATLATCLILGYVSGSEYPTSPTFLKLAKLQSASEEINRILGALLMGSGIYSIIRLSAIALRTQTSVTLRFLLLLVVVLAMTPLGNRLLYSTRYFMALLPFVLLYFLPQLKMNTCFCVRILFGMLLSALSLLGYFRIF